MISILMGIIYWFLDPLYAMLTAFLTPFGLAPLANDLLEGVWVMAGPLLGYLIKRPGASTAGELLSSAVEMVLGGQFGIMSLVAGFVQGFGAELGYLFTGYKKWNWFSLSLSVFCVTLITFARDMLFYGYSAYHFWYLLMLFIVRLTSTFIFSGVINKLVINLLEQSKVLNKQRR